MYRVLIIDDHESVCDSLEYALGKSGDFLIVATLPSALYAETFCAKLDIDILFIDVQTKGGSSGLDACEILRPQFPDLKIIVMSGFDEISYATRAKELGANAFIFKSKSLDYFIEVTYGVISGDYFFPEDKKIVLPEGETALTDREMDVLRLVCKHLTSKEIAEELFISENTVKYHKANMLAKTGFATMIDLAFYMISKGWINPLY